MNGVPQVGEVNGENGSTDDDLDVSSLPWTGERFIPNEGGPEIYYEHAHRYLTARSVLGGMTIVDLASGEGYGAAWIAEVARAVIGIDIDGDSVHHASVRYGCRDNLRFARGDIRVLPFADDTVDAVTCFEAIEHVEDPRRVVEEVTRVLKPGGLFFVSTPNKATYTDARNYSNEFHLHEFYLSELEELLDQYFDDWLLVGQRLFAGSVTWRIDKADVATSAPSASSSLLVAPGFHSGSKDDGRPALDPMYGVAACRLQGGPETGLPWPALSVLVDPEELLLDDYRQGLGPAEARAMRARLEEQDGELVQARAQLETYEATIRELAAQFAAQEEILRSVEADGRRVAEQAASGTEVVRSALRQQQELAARLRRDMDAATDLNMRLLAEIAAQQRAVTDLQLRPRSPIMSQSPLRGMRSARRWASRLRRFARAI